MTQKKFFLVLAAACALQLSVMPVKGQGIYQLPNAGFETWYRETTNANSIVPTNFNSFYSAYTTLLTAFGVAKGCDSSRDVRASATGTYSLYMYSRNASGVARANGNVTTGRMYMGSTTPSHEDNYNYTAYTVSPPKHYQEITGTPDSLRFWVKYRPGRDQTIPTDSGRIRIYIHGTGECRDAPVFPSGKVETDYYYGRAMKNFAKEDGNWHQYTVPFVYNGNNTQKNGNGNYYVLVSMTTNSVPGGGGTASGPIDEVWFDDIELVYAAYLSDLKVNGVTIANFEKGILNYAGPKPTGTPGNFAFPYNASNITAIPESDSTRSVVITNVNGPGGDADGGYTSIIVTAEDYISTKEYRIYYYANLSSDNDITAMAYTLDGGNTVTVVPSFTSSQLGYNISLTAEEVRVPQIVDTSIVLSDPKAEIFRIVQPTSVNSVGSVMVRAENYSYKTYTLNFSKVISANSKLDWIKIGGTNIADFHPDTLIYDTVFTGCVTALPTVAAATSSPWATYRITQGTMTNRTARIVVTAENGDSTVYTINFILINNNAKLTGYRIGTTNRNNFNDTTFVDVYSASFTAAQTLSVQDAQKGCPAAVIVRDTSATLYFPDTNVFTVTAQDGITTETYKVVIKNQNCYIATGANSGFRYNYNGAVNQNTAINITTTNNGNLNPVVTSVVTLPVGPNVPPELVVYGLAASAAPPTYVIDQPKHRNDTATVTLTANDGVTQKIYRVPFKATLSTVATLNDIKCNDSSIVGFAPNITNYTVMLPPSVTQVPTIVGIPTFQWLPTGNIVVIPAADLLDTTKVIVTAEDGTTTKTYYIDFDVEPVDNAYLSVLKYDNNVIAGFKPTKLNYTVDIPYSTVTPPVISGTPMAAKAHVIYSQPSTQPYQGKVLVYSENYAGMKIYTVDFNLVKNTDATLADIKINGISLQGFDPQVFLYNEVLPYTELNAPVVSATPTHPFAQVNITQIDTVTGTVTINVTAEDNRYTATYTINFTRELSPIIDLDTVKYVYNSQNYAYDARNGGTTITIMLPVETEGIPNITDIVLADNRAISNIDDQPSLINNLTGTVTVTAEDLTTEMYEIEFQRTLSASTLMTNISYSLGGTVHSINFHPDTLIYRIVLPFNTAVPVVSAVADWKYTTVQIAQIPYAPWQTALSATVNVISEDGLNVKTYTLIFEQKGSSNLITLSYNLGGSNYQISNFNPSILGYNITLPIGTTDIPKLGYTMEDSRCTVDTIQQTAPNGTSQLVVTTWNKDATTTYTVNFTVALSTEALLSDLQVDGVTIENFNPLIQLNYAMEVDYEYGISTLPVVTAAATQPDARVEITQITAYPGTAIIKVYAGDTSISKTYTIAFTMDLGNNNYLSEILIDDVHLWNFNKNVLSYEIKLPYGTTQLPEVKATAEDSAATLTITQTNFITEITVEALNGDKKVYEIRFVVRKNPNALAKNIFIDWEPLANFEPTKRNYTYILPENHSGMPFVAVELQNPNATYTIIPPTTIPAQMQIVVTAEDPDSTFSYRINFERSTSVASYDNQAEIKVYPNPTTGQLRITNYELRENTVIEIYDIYGRKHISQFTFHDSHIEIDISHLANGMYFLKVDGKVYKVIKN